jgi:uncharacterized surface protein with fasciclin (FAS1) repeats
MPFVQQGYLVIPVLCMISIASGFQVPALVSPKGSLIVGPTGIARTATNVRPVVPLFAKAQGGEASTDIDNDSSEETNTGSINDVKRFLSKEFPEFYSLIMSKNDDAWSTMSPANVDGGYTIFAPNAAAIETLGDKKIRQIKDERNLETVQKMASYHVIAQGVVTSQQLRTEDWTAPVIQGKDGALRPYKVGGIVTAGGTVPVGRSKSGGFLGWGATEDGNAVIGPSARIIQSYQIFDRNDSTKLEGLVHEVDALISPELMWRFMDQLRIPGF